MSRKRRSGKKTAGKGRVASAGPAAAVATEGEGRAEGRDEGRRGLGWRWGVAIFALAAAARAVVAWELADTGLYRQPQLDQLEFLIWARGLLEQGFSWPALPTKGPGYAAFLALLLSLFQESLTAVRLAQAALGGLTCAATAVLAARPFGRPAGVVAGLLLALYGPLVWIDTTLLAEGLFLLLLVLALLVYERRRDRPWPAVAGTGLLLGAAALVRATALALVPVFALLLLLERREAGEARSPGHVLVRLRRPRRWGAAALLAAAALAVVLPVTLPMGRTTGGSLLIQGYGGLNLYMGNRPGGSGLPAARPGGEWDRLDGQAARAGYHTAAEQDRYFTARTREAVAREPLAWLALLGQKALWLLQAEEIRESHSFYFFRRQSRLLPWLPGWGLLFPLAAWGLVVALRRRQAPAAFLLYLLVFAATCVLIIMGGRYRLPMVPVLAAFAGTGVVTAWGAGREKRWRRLGLALAVMAVAVGATQIRRHRESHNLAEEWALSGSAELSAEDLEGAEAAFQRALEEDSESALAWEGLARLRLQRRDPDGAREAVERALALNPDFALAHDSHARVLLAAGDPAGAVAALDRALELNAQYLPSLELLAPLLLRRGEVERAGEVFQQILALQPGHAAAHLGLARIEGARRRPREGMTHAARAAELAPDNLQAWMTLALLALDAGDAATAETALERAGSLAGEGAPEVLWARALLARLQGRPEAVDATLRRLLTLRPGFPPARQLFLANAAALGRRAEAEAFLAGLGHPPPG